LNQARTASTGLDGEFEVGDLPSGRYTVGVTRSGYLPLTYGQERQGEPGMPIELGDKQVLEKVNFTLERAGMISGRVLDETGEAVGGAYVWVMQSQYFRGKRRFVPVNPIHGQTDDTGQYRMASIPPGEYVVQAAFRETWMSDDKDPQMLAYAPTYFPSTANPLEGARVKVAPGQEVHAIDIMLVPGRAATLSGTVLGSDGAPLANASVALTQQTAGPSGAMMSFIDSTRAGPDGKWKIANISPGEYQLRANGVVPDRGTETVTMTVVLSGADLEGITLAADPGALISGRVVTDTGAPLPKATLRVSTSPLVYDLNARPPATPGKDDGLVQGDGTFALMTPSGEHFLRVGPLPRGWSIARIEAGRAEVTDRPVDLRPNQHTADITIVVSNTLPDVTGKVLDDRQQRAGATVLLFPTDRTRWHESGGSLRSTRPDQTGTFRFASVRPGEYLLVAVDAIQQWQVNDPEYLASVQERATKVVVGRETVSVDVKVSR
jgi:protocatechuate 3,4-dioxygenase beta subunit